MWKESWLDVAKLSCVVWSMSNRMQRFQVWLYIFKLNTFYFWELFYSKSNIPVIKYGLMTLLMDNLLLVQMNYFSVKTAFTGPMPANVPRTQRTCCLIAWIRVNVNAKIGTSFANILPKKDIANMKHIGFICVSNAGSHVEFVKKWI